MNRHLLGTDFMHVTLVNTGAGERRQMWSTGKWQFIEVKRETLCLDEVLNFNWIS